MTTDADSRVSENATADETASPGTDPQPIPNTAIRCPRCPSWWTGTRSGHCTACHRTFTSIAAFDKHRSGSHAKSTRHCVDPETVGLVPAGRAWPGWSLPGTWAGPADDAAASEPETC